MTQKQLRQPRGVGGDPPRLVAGEQVWFTTLLPSPFIGTRREWSVCGVLTAEPAETLAIYKTLLQGCVCTMLGTVKGTRLQTPRVVLGMCGAKGCT